MLQTMGVKQSHSVLVAIYNTSMCGGECLPHCPLMDRSAKKRKVFPHELQLQPIQKCFVT